MKGTDPKIASDGADPLAVTIDEAAILAASSRSEIYQALARYDLPAKKLGRRTLILKQDLRDFLRSLPNYQARSTHPQS